MVHQSDPLCAKSRRDAVHLGQSCIECKLIRPYITGHNVFEDVPAFFRVGGLKNDEEEAAEKDTPWHKMFSAKYGPFLSGLHD